MRTRPAFSASSVVVGDVAIWESGGLTCWEAGEPENRPMEYPGSDMTGIAGRFSGRVRVSGGDVGCSSTDLRGKC